VTLRFELKRRIFFLLDLLLLSNLFWGCVMPTEGHPTLLVRGQFGGAGTTTIERTPIAVYFCNDKSQGVAIETDADGRFHKNLRYFSGGAFWIFPPLGDLPRQTPPPPDICVSFPSEPGGYYSISMSRKSTRWNFLDKITGRPADRSVLVPTLIEIDLEETNKRENLNDWELRILFGN
jgi:hypothetical protein